jgi:hypothetical protein
MAVSSHREPEDVLVVAATGRSTADSVLAGPIAAADAVGVEVVVRDCPLGCDDASVVAVRADVGVDVVGWLDLAAVDGAVCDVVVAWVVVPTVDSSCDAWIGAFALTESAPGDPVVLPPAARVGAAAPVVPAGCGVLGAVAGRAVVGAVPGRAVVGAAVVGRGVVGVGFGAVVVGRGVVGFGVGACVVEGDAFVVVGGGVGMRGSTPGGGLLCAPALWENDQPSNPPITARCDMAPPWLNVHDPPLFAHQYPQNAVVGGVFTHCSR